MRAEHRAVLAAALLVVACSADKPFHLDDPHYVYPARQMLRTPLDPYAFTLNWHGRPEPAWVFGKYHPPLFPLWLVPWIAVAGESPVVLHLAQWPFVAGALLGIARLAAHLGLPAVEAVWLLAATPAFLVSSGTVMVDTASLAFMLLGLAALAEGPRRGGNREARAAAWLTCALATKQAVVPMFLVAAGFARWRRARLGRLVAWQLAGFALLGLWEAVNLLRLHPGETGGAMFPWYAAWSPAAMLSRVADTPVLLAGTGPVFLVTMLGCWRRHRGAVVWALAVAAALAVIRGGGISLEGWRGPGGAVRIWFWLATAALIAVVVTHAPAGRRPVGRALLGWILVAYAGAVAGAPFAAVRFILPALPAVVLLSLQAVSGVSHRVRAGCLALTAVLGLAMARADVAYARAARDLVQQAVALSTGHRLFTTNHWGVQYYVERAGGEEIALGTWPLHRGDRILEAKIAHSHDHTPPPGTWLREVGRLVAPPGWLPVRTIAPARDANFYGGARYPFAVTRAPAEEVVILEVVR